MIVGGAHHSNSSSVLPKKTHKEHRALLNTLRFLNKNYCVLDMCLTRNCYEPEYDIWNSDSICWHSFHEEACLFLYLIPGTWEGIRRMKSLPVWGSLDKLGPCTSFSILKRCQNLPHNLPVLFCYCYVLIHFLNSSSSVLLEYLMCMGSPQWPMWYSGSRDDLQQKL